MISFWFSFWMKFSFGYEISFGYNLKWKETSFEMKIAYVVKHELTLEQISFTPQMNVNNSLNTSKQQKMLTNLV